MDIHPTAIVSPKAELASGVKIGPYCVIGEKVIIGKDTLLASHVVIEGPATIGERNVIYQFASLGTPPQDTGYRGEDTRIVIGNDNEIREYVTINRATSKQDWETVVGNNNFLMAAAHVAHDCVVGDHVILSNAVAVAGHTVVGDHSTFGGFSATHQYVRIGVHAFIGGKVAVTQDIPPFMMASAGPGGRAKLFGPNQNGLRHTGFSREVIEGLKRAYKIIWRDNRSFKDGVRQAKEEIELFPELNTLLDFIETSKRGVAR